MSLLLLCTLATTLQAQDRVREDDLVGTTWKMVFELEEEADNVFERIVLNAVDGIMDEIDIYFEFYEDNEMTVSARAFGEDDDDEDESEWYINGRGQLIIEGSDHRHDRNDRSDRKIRNNRDDDDTVWMREGKRLIPYELERGRLVRQDEFHLIRVRR